MSQEQEKKPLGTLTFTFYKDGDVESKIDLDTSQARTINQETLMAIQMIQTTQGIVADLMSGGTIGSLIHSAVTQALRMDDDE
ncbi:hypothetical protein D3C87_777600 [compost metagenome]